MTDTIHEEALRRIHDDPQGETWEPGVSEHVTRCPGCQKTLAALRSFVTSMRRRAEREQAPPELVAQVCRTVRAEETRATRRRARVLQLAVPVALAAGLAIGAFLPRTGAGPVDVTLPNVADVLEDVLHDRFLLDDMAHTIEFSTDNPATASAWLSQNLGFDVDLPPGPAGWRLRGARLWHTVGSLSALAEYEKDGTVITIFARPAAGLEIQEKPADAPEGATLSWRMETADHRGVAWVQDGLTWVAVGTGPVEDVAGWVEASRRD